VYGVTSFAVQRRTREFGVRMALGAKPADLLALVLRQGARQLALGLIAGSAAGWFLSRPLTRVVSRIVGPPRLETYVVVFAIVGLTLAFALWWPARRAAKVDPMVALRCD
jgi:ABC-type antimicrobial peptide transport system permease subunit